MEQRRTDVYEVVVIGAGVEGSATACYLASRGTKPVLLLEQVSLQCDNVVSFGLYLYYSVV